MKKVVDNPNKGLSFLYNNVVGRIILKLFVNNSFVTNIVGLYMKSSFSKIRIKKFIKDNNINMDDYEQKKYKSFNDFFIRYIKPDKRIISKGKDDLISVCDSSLTYYKITDDLLFDVKKSKYSLKSILKNEKIANKYKDGDLLIFRLSPKDYHHYYFFDEGRVKNSYYIKGKYHTVNPIVYDKYEVFKENTRCITEISTKHFNDVLYIEVGALCVGKIKNKENVKTFKKMDEKGYFEFGGSTVILVFKKDIIRINDDILKLSKDGFEVSVKLGEKIGKIKK